MANTNPVSVQIELAALLGDVRARLEHIPKVSVQIELAALLGIYIFCFLWFFCFRPDRTGCLVRLCLFQTRHSKGFPGLKFGTSSL